MVQGVDVWVNTPRPPWEACGTSGMKVLVNGGVNLSARDGWWAEAYTPDVGWVLDGDGHDDAADAGRLYELLEREVVPSFYSRDEKGTPRAWVARMRASMASLTPKYSADRALREYVEGFYVPAARAFARRSAEGGRPAEAIAEWKRTISARWPLLRFGDVRVRTEGGQHHFETSLYLDGLDPDSVSVELYADAEEGSGPVRLAMRRASPLVGAHGFAYEVEVAETRPAVHFTPRVVASHPELAPLEATWILWAR
jgi:starch phosphorylase